MDRETRRNIAKFGPTEKKPKKKLTMEERQPIPGGFKGILSAEQPTRMFRTQRKKTYVQGTMKGKQVRTDIGPKLDIVNKVDRPTYTNTSVDVGNAVPGERAVKKKQDTPSIHVSKNTPSGINRMDTNRKAIKVAPKKDTVKPKEDKLGRSKNVPHYATKMAKELMGGKKRY